MSKLSNAVLWSEDRKARAPQHERVFGRDLKVGDLVIWFTDGRTLKITEIHPYKGPLTDLDLRLAECAGQIPSGFTIEQHNLYSTI